MNNSDNDRTGRSSRRFSCQQKYRGEWLQLSQLQYYDRHDKLHAWESVDRVDSHGAVIIIPIMREAGEIILVRQYRPPTDCFMIEFPAGLIDDGESAIDTVPRELREETGYLGRVISISGPRYSSPGMSSEQLYIAMVEIDEAYHREHAPIAQPDGNEDIETIRIKLTELNDFLDKAEAGGDGIDSRVAVFSLTVGGLYHA